MKKIIFLIVISAFLGACSAGGHIDLYGQNTTSTHTYV
jgi:hypothetical protein